MKVGRFLVGLHCGLDTVLILVCMGLMASAARAADAVSVRLNWFASGYSAPFYVGVSKGFYSEAGLDVSVQEGQGSGTTALQVAAGQSTFGFLTGDAMIRAIARGAPIIMVATLARVNGYCILVRADSGIRNGKDLEGRRYATTTASTDRALLPAFMKASGADIGKLREVSADAANLGAGLLSGQFDAIGSRSYDEPPRLEALGVKTRCLPYADVGIRTVGEGIVTNLNMIQQKPDVVRRFVETSLKAYAYSFQHPEEAATIVKKMAADAAPNEAVSIAQLKSFAEKQGAPLGSSSPEDWNGTLSLLEQYKVLDVSNPPEASRLFDSRFLPK